MLNKELNLKECLNTLNKLLDEFADWDADSESVIYVIVEGTERNRNLLNELIPDEQNLERYLDEYGNGFWKMDGIDLSGIWGEINCNFDVDIWFDAKKKTFYIK